MWRTGLLYLDRGDSAIIAALRDSGYNTQRESPASPTRRLSLSSDTESVRSDSRTRIPKQAIQQWMVPGADANGIKFPQRVKLDDPAESLSPLSDTTLFEEPAPYSLDQIKEDDAPPGYFSSQYETVEKDPSPKAQREELQSQRQRPRHQRAPSTPTTPIFNAKRASQILPVRAKTNEGLLQLQANPAKAPRPTHGHQRKISLGLPIRSPTAPADEIKQTVVSGPVTRAATEPSPPIRPSRRSGSISLVQQERELEYIHRHTFVGTASLDDFLEVLDVSPQHTTTKTAVVNAFLLLASSERQLARQASLKPTGWGLVSKTTNETVNIDYVEQAHAKLGSIVLRQFLDLIPFDEDDEASAMSVVEAFSASSYLDAKTESSISSKARAFRSWLVRQA